MNVKDSYPILGWLFKGFNLLAGLADLVPIGAMEDPNRRHHLIKANLEAEKITFFGDKWESYYNLRYRPGIQEQLNVSLELPSPSSSPPPPPALKSSPGEEQRV